MQWEYFYCERWEKDTSPTWGHSALHDHGHHCFCITDLLQKGHKINISSTVAFLETLYSNYVILTTLYSYIIFFIFKNFMFCVCFFGHHYIFVLLMSISKCAYSSWDNWQWRRCIDDHWKQMCEVLSCPLSPECCYCTFILSYPSHWHLASLTNPHRFHTKDMLHWEGVGLGV